MESKERFREGIESYRKRIINELSYMNSNIDGFVDIRNMKFELRHLVQSYRRSLEKCNMYLSYIEDLVEKKDDPKDDENVSKNVERIAELPGEDD